jgi:hypothetical protein
MPARWKQAAWPSEKFVSYHNITRSEDGGSMDLRNVGILPQQYTTSQHRTRLESGSFKSRMFTSINTRSILVYKTLFLLKTTPIDIICQYIRKYEISLCTWIRFSKSWNKKADTIITCLYAWLTAWSACSVAPSGEGYRRLRERERMCDLQVS